MKRLLILFLGVSISISCVKEETNYPSPSIGFILEDGFVYTDTTIAMGSPFNIGINAKNPEVNLTNFIIKVESDIMETYLDSGINTPALRYEKTLVKGINESEKWIFIIRDRKGNSSQISLQVIKDSTSAFGEINYYPSVDMGAQNNEVGSFYSLSINSVYNLDSAFKNQNLIDLCYFYDLLETDKNTIASPGANIEASVYPGNNGLINWETRRTTRFKIANISETDFFNAANDSLLLVMYGQSDGNRKAKNLHEGIIYSFRNEDGKVGLFRVNSILGNELGLINISIKVQE